jgi:cytochrome c-type biogenesis protein
VIELVIASFIAGVLTVAAPCILPLLPVIVGGSIASGGRQTKTLLRGPLLITLSLTLSIILFTLLLKATTVFLGVPVYVWSILSGVIIVLFGVTLLFPTLWERVMIATGWQAGASRLMARSQHAKGIWHDILLGAALGPVFNSCSPTYALIVAAVLPVSFGAGLLYLAAYAIGVGAILLLISIFGRTIADRLRWVSNPNGVFKKIIAVIFIVVGVAVLFGFDKKAQVFILDNGWYNPIMHIEESLR